MATKSLEDLDIETLKLRMLEDSIKISSKKQYDDLKPFLDKIFDLREDLIELSCYVDKELFYKQNNNRLSELRKVADKLSQRKSYCGDTSILESLEYQEYKTNVNNTIFKPFLKKIED
ncbi:hypothetical protein [Pseudoalteromonas sp. TB64]|uniref:hypothetical protein n=1 Tax=Pseudoalteromonas sp. TB64 TaxID=1938600 RepID=UPI0004643F8B|nr:hypothetical protein [Pseudoalteromonas sp. TB64]